MGLMEGKRGIIFGIANNSWGIARQLRVQGTTLAASDLSSGVTGEIHYVDAGYNPIGA